MFLYLYQDILNLDLLKKTFRILLIETYLPPLQTVKFYGNDTNLGAHLPLSSFLAFLTHQPAKVYVDKITEWMSILPSGAWSSWIVCII